MGYYMVRCDYNAAAWQELISNEIETESRLAPVQALANGLGGRFSSLQTDGGPVIAKFISFGGADLLGIVEFDSDESARAFSIAISAEPGVKNVEITPMLQFSSGVNAINAARTKGKSGGYKAPGR